jgi:IS30 family transposase
MTMANRLTMAEIDAILTLHNSEHSNRAVADLLGVDRGTVGKYIAQSTAQNQPNAPTGNWANYHARTAGFSEE